MSLKVHPWKVVEEGWDPKHMRIAESLMSIGNGYMGMRGNFEEDYGGDSHRGTYLAGVWFPDKTRVGWWKNGYPAYFGKVINAVNLIGVQVRINGVPLDLSRLAVWEFKRELDMRTGVLTREVHTDMQAGSLTLVARRFVSMAQRELLAVRYEVTTSFDAQIELTPYLDSDVRNQDANYEETFWELLDGDVHGTGGSVMTRTKDNPFGTQRFTVAAAMQNRADSLTVTDKEARKGYAAVTFSGQVKAGETVTLDKLVTVYTSRDRQEDQLNDLAEDAAEKALKAGWNEALAAQEKAWADIWRMADVQIDGDDGAQQGIRFNLFHLLSTYTGYDARLNIGPKGFTGEKYGGATYWDTEAYCLPVYMAIAGQHVARQLLLYRHQQLDGAYQNAMAQGLPGALYPMVTFTGIECHNEWEITFEEIHRNAAVAYAIFNYTQYTGDTDYETHEGLDVLCGIARFWAGRVHWQPARGVYMIHGVTGPNEYENNVNNNWYTNRMAAWCLNYFADAASRADKAHLEALGVTEDELNHMREIARKMYLPADETLQVFVQHDTFLDKPLMKADEIPTAERPINQHWSWDRILRSCFIKQADVLQGMYFLDHLYDLETVRRNFDFYEPMTVHESSLSASVHAILAARLGYRDKAVELYRRTARLDLDNVNHDTEDGLHITSMSGSWLTIAQGFAGMRTVGGLSFAPFVPEGWRGYSFKFLYRGRLVQLRTGRGRVELELISGEPLRLRLYDEDVLLTDLLERPIC